MRMSFCGSFEAYERARLGVKKMLAVTLLLLDEEDDEDNYFDELIEERRLLQIRTRHEPDRESLPHPLASASMCLLRSMNDIAYISRVGLPVSLI